MALSTSFEAADLRIFGASQKAARIESSKSFAKAVMEKYGIPTANGRTFTRLAQAQAYVKKMGAPLVVKADGLAAGKGVIVCSTEKMALDALKQIMVDREFGDAGDQVVVEECLVGEEASFLAFTDGKTVLPLPSSQDHKPVFDNDKGLNTGGMGAYSPAPVVDQYLHQRIMNEVMIPMVNGMAAEGCPYKGVLYAGLMIDRDKIKVLEFNGRFGDPEAQPLLVRMQNDIIPVIEAIIDERLDTCRLDVDPRASVCVVMAAGGYPGKYKKGLEIKGIDAANRMRDVVVFHAGTRLEGKKVLSHGGRVLGVTALGDTVELAIKKAYQAVAKIKWNRVHYRTDIGKKHWYGCRRCPGWGLSWAVTRT
jgi:phosphoribosylamine--glycine ligase